MKIKIQQPGELWQAACERIWNKRIAETKSYQDAYMYVATFKTDYDLIAQYRNLLVDLNFLGQPEFELGVPEGWPESMEQFITMANDYVSAFTSAITVRFPECPNSFFVPHAGSLIRLENGWQYTGLISSGVDINEVIAELRVIANRLLPHVSNTNENVNQMYQFRDNGNSSGQFLTAAFVEERYGISSYKLSRIGTEENRTKIGRSYAYKWSVIKQLSDAKFAGD